MAEVKEFAFVIEQALIMFRRQLEPGHSPSCVCYPCQSLRAAERVLPGIETLCLLVSGRARTELVSGTCRACTEICKACAVP